MDWLLSLPRAFLRKWIQLTSPEIELDTQIVCSSLNMRYTALISYGCNRIKGFKWIILPTSMHCSNLTFSDSICTFLQSIFLRYGNYFFLFIALTSRVVCSFLLFFVLFLSVNFLHLADEFVACVDKFSSQLLTASDSTLYVSFLSNMVITFFLPPSFVTANLSLYIHFFSVRSFSPFMLCLRWQHALRDLF